MSDSSPNQYPVFLTDEQRASLDEICRNGNSPAKKIRHAQVLLLSDRHRPGGRLKGDEIAELLGMHLNTVARIRRQFVLEGEAPAINRKARQTPPTPAIIDGEIEPQLVAICCSDPRGTRSLDDADAGRRTQESSPCHADLCGNSPPRLKKTSCSLGVNSAGASRNGIGLDLSHKWRPF
jgi:hypothetical protein